MSVELKVPQVGESITEVQIGDWLKQEGDAVASDEAVVVTAHWDHLGIEADAPADADRVYNGAMDNASGIAGMLGVGALLRGRAVAGG